MGLLFSLLLVASPSPVADPPFLVDRKAFDCLVKNADRLPRNRRKVYVDVTSCDLRIVEGNYPPNSYPLPQGSARVVQTLALDSKEIACLRAVRGRVSIIAKPADSRLYRVDFGACPKPKPR